ncbi:MAG: fused MFS/spermidine synthase [Patescibacteria group bacterium]
MPYHGYVFKIFVSAFIAGFVSLGLEIIGFRALAPYFGYSIYASSAIIGVILLALSSGYVLGGRWSDKNEAPGYVFGMVLASGLYVALSALFYKNVSQDFFSFGISLGASLSTLVIFAPPTIVLGSLSPYLIKLAINSGAPIGASSGRIYAVSTMGSLFGTFLTALFLVPRIGIRGSLFINSILVVFVALLWLFREKRAVALSLLVPLLLTFIPHIERGNVLAVRESVYSSLSVVDYGNMIGLRTNERDGTIYSFVPRSGGWQYGHRLYDLFSLPPLINGAKRSLLLGVGAGTIPLLHKELNPSLVIAGVEIDPAIIDLGNEFFGLRDSKNISRIIIEDARPFLMRETSRYDLLEIDLFWGGAEIPFYLATKEFFELTKNRLLSDGLLAMNVYDPSREGKVLSAITNTIASVYPHVYKIPAGFGSYFIIGGKKAIDLAPLQVFLGEESSRGDLVRYAESAIRPISFSQDESILTDDKSLLEILGRAS